MKQAERIKAGAIQLNVLDAGRRDGLPLLFLHGFPDFHYGWRKQVPVFEDRGYRIIAPDQRGYNLSDKPKGVAAYNLDLLGKDLINLLDTLKLDKVCVIGHDWGGATAWWLAHHHPERVKGLIVLNMPHPEEFKKHLRASRTQKRKSWYMLFFQLPGLPEWALGRAKFMHFGQSLKAGARRGAFTQQDLEKYVKAWSEPGAFTAMLNWYRAALRAPAKPFPSTAVKPPVLLIWGSKDAFLEEAMAQPSLERCQQGRMVRLPHAGHWVQQDDPEQVNDLIQEFLDFLEGKRSDYAPNPELTRSKPLPADDEPLKAPRKKKEDDAVDLTDDEMEAWKKKAKGS